MTTFNSTALMKGGVFYISNSYLIIENINSENSYSCQIILQDALNLKVIAYVGIPTGQIAKIEYDFLAEARPDLSLPSQTAEMPITK